MTTMRSRLRGVLASAVLVPALLLLGFAGPAQASNLDPAKPTSLTIHKYAGNEGTAGNGQQIGDTSQLGKPLQGVEFTITPVTAVGGTAIDLTTPAGWDLVQGATPSNVKGSGYSLGTPTKVVTKADGSVTAALPKALYLVEETSPGANNIVSPAAPFLVTLPLPDGQGNWTYDVHVYPKNKLNETTPTKAVSDPNALTLGSTVDWTVNAPVPAINSGDTYRSFSIADQLDSRLGFVSATLSNSGFAKDTHYTVSASGQNVTITLTDAGLKLLKAGDTVTAVITTKVSSLGDDGVIKNKAVVNVNNSKVETNQPSTNWGPLKIVKHVSGSTGRTLSGAEFAVYSDKEGTKQVGTVTTGSDGTATANLFVGNNDVKERTYWVKETKAPTGYILDSTVREVTVKANGAAKPVEFFVANKQRDRFNLPLTGADGQLWLTIGGGALLLLALGAGAVVTSRRKRSA